MYLWHCLGMECSEDWGGEGPQHIFSMVSHILGISNF